MTCHRFSRSFRRNQFRLKGVRYQLFEFFHAGKFVDILQAEAHQKFFGRLIENGASDDLFAASSADELAVKQRSDNTPRIDAANFADLWHCDRLLVSNDS